MLVKHSGALLVFEAFVGSRESKQLYDLRDWCREHIGGDRITTSNCIQTMRGWRMTYWCKDKQAALLFKLTWVT